MTNDNRKATAKGAASGAMLEKAARRREETSERNKGSHQKKGAERFEERAESAHGGDVEDTQD